MDNKLEEKKSKDAQAVVSLAFRVLPCKDGLYAAQMLLILDDVVVDKKTGTATTLGHAIGAADDLLDGWACAEIETTAADYFSAVLV